MTHVCDQGRITEESSREVKVCDVPTSHGATETIEQPRTAARSPVSDYWEWAPSYKFKAHYNYRPARIAVFRDLIRAVSRDISVLIRSAARAEEGNLKSLASVSMIRVTRTVWLSCG